MFKLFQNLLPSETRKKQSDSAVSSDFNANDSWETQIAQADVLWEQGKLSEALAIYGLAIEKYPHLIEIQQRLAERLKQQGDLAVAYEKLATGLKNHGNVQQAANYYRQAIHLQALTRNTKKQLSSANLASPPSPLKEAAFSFQPLTKINSALTKTSDSQPPPRVEVELNNNISPSFLKPLKTINLQQFNDIDWETAQVYLQKALEHSEKQEWEHSALACKQAVQIMPNMAEAYKIWGNALQRMGKTGEAMSCYAKAVEVEPNLAEVYAGIANIYTQQEKWQQAVKHYQKAIIIRPSATIYRSLAEVWQQLGNLDKAELNLHRARELETVSQAASSDLDDEALFDSKPSVETYCLLAEKLEQQNQWKQAALYYRKALDLSDLGTTQPALPAAVKPKLSQPKPLFAEKRGLARQSVARQSVVGVRAANPFVPIVAIAEGAEVLSVEGTVEGGGLPHEQLFQDALDGDAVSPVLRRETRPQGTGEPFRGSDRWSKQLKHDSQETKTNTSTTQLDKAIERYYKQSKLQPNSPKVHTDLGNLYGRKRKWQYAIACYRKAIDLNPQYSKAHLNLARTLFKIGKQQEFIREMQWALALEPKIGTAIDHFYLGNALADKGQLQQALGFYYKAIILNPLFSQSYYRLSEILSNQGKHKEAIDFLKLEISSNPDNAESYFCLGQQLELVDNWDGAVKIYSRLLQIEPQYPGASQKLNHALANKLKLNHKSSNNPAKTSPSSKE